MKIWSPRPLDDGAIRDNSNYLIPDPNSLISQGLLGILYRRRDSNPQGLAPSRFWVCRVYHSTTSAFWLPVCQRTTVFVSTIPLYFKECLLKNVLKLFSQILYARWDSNPQPRRARLLRPLCIPNSTTHAYIQRTISRPSRTRTLSFRVGAGNVALLHQRPILFARAEGFEPPRALRP